MSRARSSTVALAVAATALAVAAAPAAAAPTAAAAQADTDVVTLDRDLVRLDTSNPPGNELAVAEHMRDRLAPLGFEVEVVQTPTPGKAHLIARLPSVDPVGKPVLLSAHADTVGVERDLWSVDPFAGAIRGGYLYGRGSFDDKGGIAVFAAAAIRLAQTKMPSGATSCSSSRPTRRAATTASSGSRRTTGTSSTPRSRSTRAGS
jgi:hypothetical protein